MGIRLDTRGSSGEFITVLAPHPTGERIVPAIATILNGVRIDDTDAVFSGGIDDDDAVPYVTITRGGRAAVTLTGRDIDMDRSQGDVGLFARDVGYPCGEIPNGLVRQRLKVPDRAPEWAKEICARRQ